MNRTTWVPDVNVIFKITGRMIDIVDTGKTQTKLTGQKEE